MNIYNSMQFHNENTETMIEQAEPAPIYYFEVA